MAESSSSSPISRRLGFEVPGCIGLLLSNPRPLYHATAAGRQHSPSRPLVPAGRILGMGNERWILEHTRSTAAEGRRVMFGTTATGIALAVLLPMGFPDIWHVDRVFSLAFYGIL